LQSYVDDVGLELSSGSASVDPWLLGRDSWFYNGSIIDQFDHVVFPHWFPIVLFLAFAVLPWLRWRFGLRALLLATTLAAVGLG
jgi:hypothetical protein